MVYKVMQSRFRVFLESSIIAMLLLIIGFSIGLYVENVRTSHIVETYKDHEVEALDLKLQNYYYQIMDSSSCEQAIEQNFKFADDVYITGLNLEKFEETNQITDDLFRDKKRYSLLKTELWLNTILLKKKCNAPFDTLAYIYAGDPQNTATVAEQKIISNVLRTIKEERGNSLILLPIAGDLKIGSIDLQKKIYRVDTLPVLVINEKILLSGFHTKEEIEVYLTNFSAVFEPSSPYFVR
jgi:hypothetical protein